jgi:hypothetical protein
MAQHAYPLSARGESLDTADCTSICPTGPNASLRTMSDSLGSLCRLSVPTYQRDSCHQISCIEPSDRLEEETWQP